MCRLKHRTCFGQYRLLSNRCPGIVQRTNCRQRSGVTVNNNLLELALIPPGECADDFFLANGEQDIVRFESLKKPTTGKKILRFVDGDKLSVIALLVKECQNCVTIVGRGGAQCGGGAIFRFATNEGAAGD